MLIVNAGEADMLCLIDKSNVLTCTAVRHEGSSMSFCFELA